MIQPTSRGRKLVRKHHHKVIVRIAIAYTPTGGKTSVHTAGGIQITG